MKELLNKIVKSEIEMKEFAIEFFNKIEKGSLVCLNGNLGVGKTFFVKAICEYLNIDNSSSPTFSIVNEYSGKEKIYHFDFYRLKNSEELFDIGFNEYLSDEDAYKFVEWAELIPEVLPKHYYEVKIDTLTSGEREIFVFKK